MSDLIHPDYLNPRFLFSNLRPRFLLPKARYASVADIDTDTLVGSGIHAVIFDVDNTLCRYHGTTVDDAVLGNFERMRARFNTCIISNTDGSRRAELEQHFGMHVVQSRIRKPRPEPFLEALSYLGTAPGETAMIGDRLLTDIVGANRLGIYSIHVRPRHLLSEPLLVMLARGFEMAAYHLMR